MKIVLQIPQHVDDLPRLRLSAVFIPEKSGMKWLYPGWMLQDRSCRVFWTGASDSTKAGVALRPAPGGRGLGALVSLNSHISFLRMCD